MLPASLLAFGVAPLPVFVILVGCERDSPRADLDALASSDGRLYSVRVLGVVAREEGGRLDRGGDRASPGDLRLWP